MAKESHPHPVVVETRVPWPPSRLVPYDCRLWLWQRWIAATLLAGLATSALAQPVPIDVNVLVLNFDPRVTDGTNRLVRDVLGFFDPHELAVAHQQAVAEVSGGYLNYQIVQWQDIDAIPVKQDGFSYTADQYVHLWQNGGPFHQSDLANYSDILSTYVPPTQIDQGLIDEVWLFGGPYFGYYESAMAGPGSFNINGGTYPGFATEAPFAIMGFNYERGGNGEGTLHGLGHRFEASISRYFGGWDIQNPQTLWDQYTANLGQTTAGPPYGVGSVHFPANGTQDYDYSNGTIVPSNGPDWLNYPHLSGTTYEVSADTWGNTEDGYLRYWFSHLPRGEGVNKAVGKLNNWWRYVYDLDNIDLDGLPKGDLRIGPNGHFYLFVESRGITWEDALNNAADLVEGAYSGHLVTITDQEEMDFVVTLSHGREVWLGASDSAIEGVWTWVVGPEQGEIFLQAGVAIGFSSFGAGEPNGGMAENALHLLGNNRWNDVSNTYPNNAGYIVEFSVLVGDFDLDADVDGGDLLQWQRAESRNPASSSDLVKWQAAFGSHASAALTGRVPEPRTTSLLIGALLLVGSTRVPTRSVGRTTKGFAATRPAMA
jgi:hypothetical protein